MIYKFRAILDAEDDVIRDIAIDENDTLEDLHNALFNAFGFDGMEVASFYTCDDTWNQEDEIAMFDSGEVEGEQRIMSDYALNEVLHKNKTKIIYVYDFINMWTFLVELAAIEDAQTGIIYPNLLFSAGVLPEAAPDTVFEADGDVAAYNEEFEDDLDDDDLDGFGEDRFEDFGFEENWN